MTESIVLGICKKYRVKPADFFDPLKRTRKMGQVRRAAIEALLAAGFSGAGAARMTRLNYSTIQYWTHPEYREKRSRYFKRFNAERKKECSSIGVLQSPSLSLNG